MMVYIRHLREKLEDSPSDSKLIKHTGIPGILMRTVCQMITRFVPRTITAYYLIVTTTVSEFLAAMEKLKMPQAVVIPLAVIFRFLPMIKEKYRAIRDAMNIRGVGNGENLIAAMEYRMVPLIMSVVKIADELSAAVLSRGMGSRRKRTNLCRIGFARLDVLLILKVTYIAAVYLISALM